MWMLGSPTEHVSRMLLAGYRNCLYRLGHFVNGLNAVLTSFSVSFQAVICMVLMMK